MTTQQQQAYNVFGQAMTFKNPKTVKKFKDSTKKPAFISIRDLTGKKGEPDAALVFGKEVDDDEIMANGMQGEQMVAWWKTNHVNGFNAHSYNLLTYLRCLGIWESFYLDMYHVPQGWCVPDTEFVPDDAAKKVLSGLVGNSTPTIESLFGKKWQKTVENTNIWVGSSVPTKPDEPVMILGIARIMGVPMEEWKTKWPTTEFKYPVLVCRTYAAGVKVSFAKKVISEAIVTQMAGMKITGETSFRLTPATMANVMDTVATAYNSVFD